MKQFQRLRWSAVFEAVPEAPGEHRVFSFPSGSRGAPCLKQFHRLQGSAVGSCPDLTARLFCNSWRPLHLPACTSASCGLQTQGIRQMWCGIGRTSALEVPALTWLHLRLVPVSRARFSWCSSAAVGRSGRSGPASPRLSGGGACQVAGVAWCCRLGLGGPGVCAAVVSPRTRKFSGTLWPHCAGPRRPVCSLHCLLFLFAPPGVRRVASLVVWSPPSPFCRPLAAAVERTAGGLRA